MCKKYIFLSKGEKNTYKYGVFFDLVEFMISANAGENLMPLHKIASGGELSRVMLSIKSVLLDKDPVGSMIFDEIDTGVSGAVATSIGLKMALLSNSAQVFSVTHLAQVAACADQHVYVQKALKDERSVISIGYLDENQRIEQLAMISSGVISDVTLNAAKELYHSNQIAKS